MPKPRKRPAQTHSESETRCWIAEAAAAGPVDSPLDCVKCAHRITNAVGLLGIESLTPRAIVQIDEWTCRLMPSWLRHRGIIDAACLQDPPLTWCGLSGSPVEVAFDYGRRVVSLAWLSDDARLDDAYSAIVNAGLPRDGAPTPLGEKLWAIALPVVAETARGLCPSFELQGIMRDRLNRLASRLGIAAPLEYLSVVNDRKPASHFDRKPFNITPDTLKRAAADGRLKNSIKVGGRWRHSEAEVAAYYGCGNGTDRTNRNQPDDR